MTRSFGLAIAAAAAVLVAAGCSGHPTGTGNTPHTAQAPRTAAAAGSVVWKGPSTGFISLPLAESPNGTFYGVDSDQYPRIFGLDGRTGQVVCQTEIITFSQRVVTSLVVAGGSVFALDLKAEVFRFDLGLTSRRNVSLHHGILGASPTAGLAVSPDGSLVLAATHTIGSGATLHAVQTASLAVAWSAPLFKHGESEGALAVSHTHAFAFGQNEVVAVRLGDGGVGWTRGVDGAAGGVLAPDGSALYVAAGKAVQCLSLAAGAEGTLLWSTAVSDTARTPVLGFGGALLFVPTADHALSGLATGSNGSLTFHVAFKYGLSDPITVPATGLAYVAETSDGMGGQGAVHALSRSDGGAVLWSTPIMNVDGAISLGLTSDAAVLVVPADYFLGLDISAAA